MSVSFRFCDRHTKIEKNIKILVIVAFEKVPQKLRKSNRLWKARHINNKLNNSLAGDAFPVTQLG